MGGWLEVGFGFWPKINMIYGKDVASRDLFAMHQMIGTLYGAEHF